MTSTMAQNNQTPTHNKQPIFFEEFFNLGLEETASPFIKKDSRKWGENGHLKTAILSIFLLIISFALSFHPTTKPLSNLTLIAVYFFVGVPALIVSIEDLFNFNINIDLLMTLAAFSSVLIGSGMEGALLLVLFAVSHAMEDAVTAKAKSAINTLNKLSPTTAYVIQGDGILVERSVKDVVVGNRILIKAGQVIPLDGVVIEGSSSINLAHLTGENLPMTKKPGDEVPSGGRNLEGALVIEVTRTSSDSTLSQIIKLVTQAQEAHPKLQKWFDKLSRTYAITIILSAATLALTMPLVLGIPFFSVEGSLYRSLAFLIAASPCALIIAVPIAYLSAISACAKKGILLKGGVTLDDLGNSTVMAFDKTGTLTTGVLKCKAIESTEGLSQEKIEEAVSVAYTLERNAVHPIAQAIFNYGEEKGAPLATIQFFKSIPGYGLEALFTQDGREVKVAIGHSEFIASMLPASKAAPLKKRTDEIKKEGDLVATLLVDESPFIFRFEDTVRPHIKEVLQSLRKKYGMQLLMLTGDHEESARKVALEMGIDDYYANLKPEDKLNYIGNIAVEKGLAMVGDGVNDAPALARASVGICMGKIGSSAAIDAADIVLLNDNIELLGWLVGKSKQTQRIVRQNLIVATAAILFASMPALGGYVPLWLAVILHEGGTVLVGLNALRLIKD